MSSRSSRTWKARPNAAANVSRRARVSASASAASAPIRTAARTSAPVLSECMRCSCASAWVWPVASMSSAWPPHMPDAPEAVASASTQSILSCAGASARASAENARVCSASPARIALASSKATCTVGWPRRRASSSIAGRSSWTSE